MHPNATVMTTAVLMYLAWVAPLPAHAQDARITAASRAPFAKLPEALNGAISEEKMGLVCRTNTQRGVAALDVTIKDDQVMMVLRPDFAVRLLAADPRAGFEAPVRIYLYENPDAMVSYLPPSAVFAPYRNPEVQAIGAELDPIFKAIVDGALAVR